ncbi:MAG: KamA family radical SAM protein [Patescibacteria group bacterium]|jgi:lysine 2,3-aminomutase
MPLENWQKDLRHCVRNIDELESYIAIKDKELLRKTISRMRLSITPHTLKLIDFKNPHDPLLRMCLPQAQELAFAAGETHDPIGDDKKSPLPFLVHRYPDRALIHATYVCAQYCRFCFRRTKTGHANPGPSAQDRAMIIKYIADHPGIEEAILSGGDPLMLTDQELAVWLKALSSVPTLQRIRIHTRLPVTLPSRVTPSLVRTLKRFQKTEFPIYLVTHFNHPQEIAADNVKAIARLVNAGIVVRNQSVLLKDVNDDLNVMTKLLKRLIAIRIVPYYVHQLDKAQGINHFRVPVNHGKKLIAELHGHLSSIAIPKFMLDSPDGSGKKVLAA